MGDLFGVGGGLMFSAAGDGFDGLALLASQVKSCVCVCRRGLSEKHRVGLCSRHIF